MNKGQIVLKNARVHNLKGVNLTLNHDEFIVFTGVSGSGKSSLAFDTLFVEGQRRYLESFPHSLRNLFFEREKPDVEKISGLTPTVAIEQKSLNHSARSTVGTLTEIYDYLRVLFAKLAIPHCPTCNRPVQGQTKEKILEDLESFPEGKKIFVMAPFIQNKKGSFKDEIDWLRRLGYLRLRIDGKIEELENIFELDPKKTHSIDIIFDRLITAKDEIYRLKEAASHALEAGKGSLLLFALDSGEEFFFSTSGYCPNCKISYPALTPSHFSFNHPSGMCPRCEGIGKIREFILDRIIDAKKSIREDCCSIAPSYETVRYKNIYDNLAKIFHFSVDTPWENLSQESQQIFLYGSEKKWLPMTFHHPVKKTSWIEYVHFPGVLKEAENRLKAAKSSLYHAHQAALMEETICPHCQGTKLAPYPAKATLLNQTIFAISEMSISEAFSKFFKNFSFANNQEEKIGKDLIHEINKRLELLNEVGLSYLSLNRSAQSLSGGEAQRVKLAGHIGSGLSGTTYILDEPSIGLHPIDHHRLLKILKNLRDEGNTVIVIEHDIDTMLAADTLVDIGPLAGHLGGEIIAQGSAKQILENRRSITGDYLAKRKEIVIPKKRKIAKNTPSLNLLGAHQNNLKHIDVKIPLECFVAITGVSGSGKSTLITDTLFPALEEFLNNPKNFDPQKFALENLSLTESLIKKVILIDQSPIGKTPRSNPATYVQLFEEIRKLFTLLPTSQIKGFTQSHFSFNVEEGSCPYCKGLGNVKIEIENLQEAEVVCPQCQGKRFSEEILSIRYKGKNIHDVLEMEIKEAKEFFQNIPNLFRKLSLLDEVGLGYIRLGQSATTLSGGEAQRIKLAKELSRSARGNTLYLLDEPTTGLHLHDIEQLLSILQRLVDKKNSVVVIEHNMELVKTADWVIELGPEGGDKGGKILIEASPESLKEKKTPTGKFLKKAFAKIFSFEEEKISKKPIEKKDELLIRKAEQNNLKSIDVTIPYGKWVGFCGLSGSGRTSLAFDTIFQEGQRRYLETLSPYLRQFFKQSSRPKVEKIENLIPTIALEQKSHVLNPRSTLGTLSETYDSLRILFAHLGQAFCPETQEPIESITKEFVKDQIQNLPLDTKIQVLAPVELFPKENFAHFVDRWQREGFLRIRLNHHYYEFDEPIPFDAAKKNEIALVIDRLIVSPKLDLGRLSEAISLAAHIASDTLIVDQEGEDLFFNLRFAVKKTGKSYPPLTPQSFSFNSERGMCPDCQGLGFLFGAEFQFEESFLNLSLERLSHLLFKNHFESQKMFCDYFHHFGFSLTQLIQDFSQKEKEFLFFGEPSKSFGLQKKKFTISFLGLNPILAKAAKHGSFPFKEALTPHMTQKSCFSCKGSRLNPLARHVRLNGKTIVELTENFSLDQLLEFLKNLSIEKKPFLKETLEQLKKRLEFLIKIGLNYLSLGRNAPTLSGGELQRLKLARHLGSYLSSCLYLIDEPTMGLHPHNIEKLILSLKELIQEHNSLIVVGNDLSLLKEADLLFEFGPLSGEKGGKILASGSPKELEKKSHSLIGPYLSKTKKIPLKEKREILENFSKIKMQNASLHNLKNVNVDIPLGVLTCVTGVSGSGKSTLIQDILYSQLQSYLKNKTIPENLSGDYSSLQQVISFEHITIRATHRADVASFSDLLTPIREIFSSLPEAAAKGLLPRYFSYYHKKGMCQTCYGLGYQKVNLYYLPSTEIICESCHGYRLNPLSLTIEYHKKHLGEVLELTIAELVDFFHVYPKIRKKAELLCSLGLGYLKLKQEIATLSFGELQRLHLFKELIKRPKGSSLYLFDEPSLGLHPEELLKIIPYFHELVKKGHSVLLIEHNLDLIKEADYIIDLGPEGGDKGGKLLFSGPFEEFLKNKTSLTAKYLKEHLKSLI